MENILYHNLKEQIKEKTFPKIDTMEDLQAVEETGSVVDAVVVKQLSLNGGGVELEEPTAIAIVNADSEAILTWTDPDNIVISGVTVARWKGTLVVRKIGSVPQTRYDGTIVVDSLIKNQYQSTGYHDTGLTNGVTYYYGFFPHTTSDTYTTTAIRTFTPSVIYPDGVSNFNLTKGYESAMAEFTSPEDIAGVRLVYGTHEPVDETDGTYIDGVTSPYTIDNLTNGTEYHVKAFTYNAKGRYTASEDKTVIPSPVTIKVTADSEEFIGATVTITGGTTQTKTFDSTLELTFTFASTGTYIITNSLTSASETINANELKEYSVEFSYQAFTIFAVHYSETNSDPSSCDYPAGYDNSNWTPMYVDLNSENSTYTKPVYNSWNPAGVNSNKLSWLFPKSCMLKYDGTVDYYLDEDDESKKADGTTSDYNNTSYAGNAMMEWGQNGQKLYWKIVPDSNNDGWTFIIANAPVDKDGNPDPDMKPWNHYNADGAVIDHFYTPKYMGSYDGTRLRSLSGQSNMVSQNAPTEITRARANNLTSDIIWDTEVCADWVLEHMLYTLLSRSLASQLKWGYGYVNGNSAAIQSGTMDGKGMFYGEDTGKLGNKIFGRENPYSNIRRRIRGLIGVGNGTKCDIKVKMTHGKDDGTTVSDYNMDGTGYLEAGQTPESSGYISAMNIQKYGLFPKSKDNGGDSVYYGDYVYVNKTADRVNYAVVGGYWNNRLNTGSFYANLSNMPSNTNSSIGAALSCKPAKYVNGVKIVSWATGTEAELQAMLDAHYAGTIDIHDYWNIGDERTVSLSAMDKGAVGETHVAQDVTMVLMNAGGKTLANGKTCAFVVGQKNSLANRTTRESGYINSTNTNVGGWKGSARRTWCNETYYNAIASSFKALFKQFINKSGTGGGSSSGTEDTTDWTALPAEVEVFGSTTYSVSGEGSQFKYYETSANRIKKAGDSGSDGAWWERSPHSDNSSSFCYVTNAGNANSANSSGNSGLAPFGCI